jgi:tetratricopeptide (TPR) repeat protein
MRSGFPLANFWLGRIYTQEGRYADARAALESIGPLRIWTPAMAALGYLEARSGHVDAAHRILAEFDTLAGSRRYASPYAIAVVHAGLGDRERVIALLREAVRERSHWVVWLARDPRFDAVRADPRFVELVRQVGLP